MTTLPSASFAHDLFQAMPDALLLVDADGRIVQTNALADRLFDYPAGGLCGQPLEILLPEHLRVAHRRHLDTYFRNPRLRPMGSGLELTAQRRDGRELAVEISLSPLSTRAGTQVLAVVRDVMEHRQTQRRLQRAAADLAQQIEARSAELRQLNIELQRQTVQRQQMEQDLSTTRELYRQLVENQPDLICRFLPDTTLTFVNTAYARFYGRAPEDLLGRRFIDWLASEEKAGIEAQLANFTPACPAQQYEHTAVRADSARCWHLWHDFAFFDEQGRVTGFQSVGVDITERKRIEERLRDSEQTLRMLLNATTDVAFLVDTGGTILVANETLARLLGRPVEALRGTRFFEHLPRALAEPCRVHLAEAIRSGRPFHFEDQRDGLYFDNRLFPILDGEGRVTKVAVFSLDITERKRAEETLRQTTAELQSVFRALPDLCFRWARDGRVLGCMTSDVRRPCVDWTPGRRLQDLLPPSLGERLQQAIVQALDLNSTVSLEFPLVETGGEHLFEVRLAPLLEDEVIAVIRDITAHKQAERALFAEKERAQVTLHSIGDAVITTNAHGRVDYLNPVAELLTGWTLATAHDQPLETVFHIVAERSRAPVLHPVRQCLEAGEVVNLSEPVVLVSRTGREYAIDESAAPIRGQDGSILGAVLVFHDVTELRQMTRQLAHDATHDALTGLVNRREFESRLERALIRTKQYGIRHVLCFLDLDEFKHVNDTAGHVAGDELLKAFKHVVSGLFRERDTLGRLGGDEFGLLLTDCPLERARIIAENLVERVHRYRFLWQGQAFQIGVSVGLVPVTPASINVGQLLGQADTACYTAKKRGRNQVFVYPRETG
jgi:diguanylate cyclase (GGDEF)-like protein/PAS domain S-box-containing protein